MSAFPCPFCGNACSVNERKTVLFHDSPMCDAYRRRESDFSFVLAAKEKDEETRAGEKGAPALVPSLPSSSPLSVALYAARDVSLARLLVDVTKNPRKTRASAAADLFLRASMQRRGLISPVLVREIAPESFLLIAGYRRVAAARALSWETISARVVLSGDEESDRELALLENEGRVSMSVWDKCDLAGEASKKGIPLANLSALLTEGGEAISLRRAQEYVRVSTLPITISSVLMGHESGYSFAASLTQKTFLRQGARDMRAEDLHTFDWLEPKQTEALRAWLSDGAPSASVTELDKLAWRKKPEAALEKAKRSGKRALAFCQWALGIEGETKETAP